MTEPIKLMDLMSEDQCNQLMYMRILSIVEDAKGGETPYTMIWEALMEMGFKLEKYSWLSDVAIARRIHKGR